MELIDLALKYNQIFPGTITTFHIDGITDSEWKQSIREKLEKAIATNTPTTDKELGLELPDDANT